MDIRNNGRMIVRLDGVSDTPEGRERLARSYISSKDGQVKEIYLEYLFLKPLEKAPPVDERQWGQEYADHVAPILEDHLPEVLSFLIGHINEGLLRCIFCSSQFTKTLAESPYLQEMLLNTIKLRGSPGLAKLFNEEISTLDKGAISQELREKLLKRAEEMDDC